MGLGTGPCPAKAPAGHLEAGPWGAASAASSVGSSALLPDSPHGLSGVLAREKAENIDGVNTSVTPSCGPDQTHSCRQSARHRESCYLSTWGLPLASEDPWSGAVFQDSSCSSPGAGGLWDGLVSPDQECCASVRLDGPGSGVLCPQSPREPFLEVIPWPTSETR